MLNPSASPRPFRMAISMALLGNRSENVLFLHWTEVVDPGSTAISIKISFTQTQIMRGVFHSAAGFWLGNRIKALPSVIPIGPVFSYLRTLSIDGWEYRNSPCSGSQLLWPRSVYFIRSHFSNAGLGLNIQLVLTLQRDALFFPESSRPNHPLPERCRKDLSLEFSLEGTH